MLASVMTNDDMSPAFSPLFKRPFSIRTFVTALAGEEWKAKSTAVSAKTLKIRRVTNLRISIMITIWDF